MANLAIHKFRFPQGLRSLDNQEITFSDSVNELIDQLVMADHILILCGLSSKEDLLQIISFYQKKKQALKDIPHSIILVDFQDDKKLLEAAERLSLDKVYKEKNYLETESEILSGIIEKINANLGKLASHQTYEDLFSTDKVVLKKNTRRRLYPVDQESIIANPEAIEVMVESPVVSFKIYAGEKLIDSTFLDYFDREIYLKTKVLPEDNNLILEFKFSYLNQKKGIRLKAEVINIEEDDGEYQLTLKIESHLKEFELMLKVFQAREKNISLFLKKVKGY